MSCLHFALGSWDNMCLKVLVDNWIRCDFSIISTTDEVSLILRLVWDDNLMGF